MDVYNKFIPLAQWKVLIDDWLDNPGQEAFYNLKPDARETVYDAIFIGGGASGRFGAAALTARGGRALVVDKWPFLGGSCPHEACVPHHIFSEAARELDYAREFGGEFWYPEWDATKASILEVRDMFMKNRNTGHSIMNFQSKEQLGLEFILGSWATVIDKNTVEVDGVHYRTKNIVLCVGARPTPPDIPGIEKKGVYDWSSILEDLDYEPNRCVVIGGGKTAIEYGSFFQATGCHTTYLSRSPLMGTKVCTTSTRTSRGYVKMIEHRGSGVSSTRVPNRWPYCLMEMAWARTRSPGCASAPPTAPSTRSTPTSCSSAPARRRCRISSRCWAWNWTRRAGSWSSKHMRTSVPKVWAAGDLIDGPMEMFKARKAGVCAARNIMGETDYAFDYSDYPDFLHTTYEVAWTGLERGRGPPERFDNVMVIQMPPKGVAPEDCGSARHGRFKILLASPGQGSTESSSR